MKNKELEKVWSERHLPADLWPEILSRLPVKSLLRFRCVSKSWLCLINNADFLRLHLQNFKNRHETHLLVIEGSKRNCVVRCSDTFKPYSETVFSLENGHYDGSWEIACSIDGLVLLKSYMLNHLGFNDLRVWNPSIRKSHDFPPMLDIGNSNNRHFKAEDIGFGYDPLINDYKHVRLIFVKDPIVLHSVAVYTLGVGSWKINQTSNWHWNFYDRKTIYLRGSLYLIAEDTDNHVLELVSVDLSNEVFSSTSLPGNPYFCADDHSSLLTLFDNGCSLGVLNYEGVVPCLWVLESSTDETESMRWSQRYRLGLNVPHVLYIKRNGVMLLWRPNVKSSIRLATGRRVKQRRDLVSSFNFETQQEKILLQRRYLKIRAVCGYVESLILLK